MWKVTKNKVVDVHGPQYGFSYPDENQVEGAGPLTRYIIIGLFVLFSAVSVYLLANMESNGVWFFLGFCTAVFAVPCGSGVLTMFERSKYALVAGCSVVFCFWAGWMWFCANAYVREEAMATIYSQYRNGELSEESIVTPSLEGAMKDHVVSARPDGSVLKVTSYIYGHTDPSSRSTISYVYWGPLRYHDSDGLYSILCKYELDICARGASGRECIAVRNRVCFLSKGGGVVRCLNIE